VYNILTILVLHWLFLGISLKLSKKYFFMPPYTPLAVVSRTRKTLRVSTTAGIAQIPAVSSKEGAVIGAVLSTQNH
jgi:hypothetical protein